MLSDDYIYGEPMRYTEGQWRTEGLEMSKTGEGSQGSRT